MTPQMVAALESASNRARTSLVVECALQSGPTSMAADVWRALADSISDWEPGDPSGPVDHRLVLAVDALTDQHAYMLPRLLTSSGDDLLVSCGLEVEAARMRVLEMRHDLWEATRQTWPQTDNAE
jgi:hypothetical protein